jgi:NitT/TauT family transport system permease protein
MTRFRIASIVALFAVWLVLAAMLPASIVPGPRDVGAAMWSNIKSGQAFVHLFKTLVRVGVGLVLTMLLGIAVGAAMGLSKKFEVFLDAWVMVGLTIPAIVYSIICLLWFGLNDRAAIIAIGVSAFPTVAISIWQGIKGLDTQLSGMGTAFHLSNSAIFRKIIVPQIVPQILASMRSALGICWKICTTVELVGMSSGVGYMLNYWFGQFKMSQVFAWTLLFLMVMFGIEYFLFKPIEIRLTRWRA